MKELCKRVERDHNVKILFAVEAGSRAWRMHSKDSDYDVRFVFVRPMEEYIQISQPKDVINIAFDSEKNPCPVPGALYDFCGFDIIKFVKLLSTSNPSTIEWLMSDIVYLGEQNLVFKRFALENFNKVSLYHHYKSMCRGNFLKYIKSGDLVTFKKYLYSIRGLINAKWVLQKKSIPPIIFTETLKKMQDSIPEKIYNKLFEIIDLKTQGLEKDRINNIIEFDSYIENFLNDDIQPESENSRVSLDVLNSELRKIII